jgi:hypothetical protein
MTPPVLYFDLGNTLVHGPTGAKVPFPDAVATIETVWQRGYRIGLLSDQAAGTTIAQMITKLGDYGLDASKFDAITISSEFDPPKHKPDPDIFEHALGKVGYSAGSSRTVFVTESLDHIEAARDLGWRAIHIPFEAACTPSSGECVETLDDLLDLFPPLAIDVYIRDSSSDDGDEPSTGAFWNSPDLWIRNANDGGTAHQNPVAGQDNWFCARLHNRGEGIARTVVVTHTVQEWAGTQFVFPADFTPYTALIGHLNLVPDVPAVVAAKWESADVPAEGTHACWLSAAYVTGDPIAGGAHVWEANNLAQKNLTIVEMAAGETAELAFVIGNRAVRAARRVVLELWQSAEGPQLSATLGTADPAALSRAVRRAERLIKAPAPVAADPSVGLRFLDAARVELTGLLEAGGETAIMELAPGSRMSFPRAEPQPAKARPRFRTWSPAPLSARLVESAKGAHHVAFAQGEPSGIALGLRAGEILRTTLTLMAPRDAEPGSRITLDLLQRDANGTVVGGVSVGVVITERKTGNKSKMTRAEPARGGKTRRTRS